MTTDSTHSHTLPLTVTLETKDYHTTNSVSTEHIFNAIILSWANVRSCWTVMAGRCIKADVTVSNGKFSTAFYLNFFFSNMNNAQTCQWGKRAIYSSTTSHTHCSQETVNKALSHNFYLIFKPIQ